MDWGDEAPRAGPLFEAYARPGSGLVRFDFDALGTRNVLLLAVEEGPEARRLAQRAIDLVEGLEARLSKFRGESQLSFLNALGAVRPISVGPDLLDLLRRSREAWEITEGAFDPTVGPLLEAWGLVDLSGRVPSEEEIEAALALRGMDLVELDATAHTARLRRPGVTLDLGAIGKGLAVDRVAEAMRDGGVPSGAAISGRSTLVVWGEPPGGGRWRVAVTSPDDPDEPVATLRVGEGAVSSSGASERCFRRGTETYGHVLDPRTGRPVRRVAGATVWSRDALLGDVLSTALFVRGGEAAAPGGPLERLVRAWTPAGEAPRATFLWLETDPGVWGGLRVETRHLGEPPVDVEAA